MPGLDYAQVSSNWKKLQEKFQVEKSNDVTNGSLKRKRVDDKDKLANGHKRPRLQMKGVVQPANHRKMGMSGSKSQEQNSTEHTQSNLAQKHGISNEDISAAYGTTNSTAVKHVDNINGGLHATHKVGKYVALDCEMVGTGPPPHLDHVLARASLVNFHGEQIYDSYVLPPPGIKVEDYRTFVSGIKRSHLIEGYARSFTQVQKDVADLLQDRILVGHALRNDLQTLLLSHPKRDSRDTSRYPKFKEENGGKPPALRKLAKSELGMDIQTGEHSSIEDARAAMMLFWKEKNGFEEENVKHFGRHTKFQSKAGKKEKANGTPNINDVDEDENEDDDRELLGSEEDEWMANGETGLRKASLPVTKKKKTKKKKRTKRK